MDRETLLSSIAFLTEGNTSPTLLLGLEVHETDLQDFTLEELKEIHSEMVWMERINNIKKY